MSTSSFTALIPANSAYASAGSTTLPPGAMPTIDSSPCSNSTIVGVMIPYTISAAPVNNKTIAAMQACCGTNPVVLFEGGCGFYCTAPNQTMQDQISNCLGTKGIRLGTSGSMSSGSTTSVKLTGVLLTAFVVGGMLVGL